MKKQSDKGSGVSFSPELLEVLGRLKGNEPELTEVVSRDAEQTEREEADGREEESS